MTQDFGSRGLPNDDKPVKGTFSEPSLFTKNHPYRFTYAVLFTLHDNSEVGFIIPIVEI